MKTKQNKTKKKTGKIKNIVLHNVILNMNATTEIVVRLLLDLNTSVIIDCESPTKILLKVEEDKRVSLHVNEPESSINLVAFPSNILLSDVSVYIQFWNKE